MLNGMKPYLVRTRIPGLVTPEGAMAIFITLTSTEQEALEAVSVSAPLGWTVEEVIGQATDRLAAAMHLRPGEARQLTT